MLIKAPPNFFMYVEEKNIKAYFNRKILSIVNCFIFSWNYLELARKTDPSYYKPKPINLEIFTDKNKIQWKYILKN